MPRRPAAPPLPDAARLRDLVAADGRPQTEIAEAIGWTKQELWQRLNGANLTVGSAAAVLAAIRITDPRTGRRRSGRLADLD